MKQARTARRAGAQGRRGLSGRGEGGGLIAAATSPTVSKNAMTGVSGQENVLFLFFRPELLGLAGSSFAAGEGRPGQLSTGGGLKVLRCVLKKNAKESANRTYFFLELKTGLISFGGLIPTHGVNRPIYWWFVAPYQLRLRLQICNVGVGPLQRKRGL